MIDCLKYHIQFDISSILDLDKFI